MREQSCGDGVARREGSTDREIQRKRFRIDISDINTSFVREQNAVALALGVDADVIFCVRGVWQERLEDEVVECARDGLNLREESVMSSGA